MEGRPYFTLPSDDEQFADAVGEAMALADNVHSLRRLLISKYPNMTVVEQAELARAGARKLYVFRDGRLIDWRARDPQ